MEIIGLSVVIPTKDGVDRICKCIRSLLEQTLLPNEIVVVDSSDNNRLNSTLKREFPVSPPQIRYIHSNVGLTAARNIGVQKSSGEIVFFFDDDVILDKNYIEEIVKVFMNDKDGKIGGVMGKITNVPRVRTRAHWRNVLNSSLERLFYQPHRGNGKFLPSGFPTFVNSEKRTMRTEFLSGCMMAYRRNVFNTHVFDERLGKLSGYCFMEDVDFSYRVSQRYTLMYTPLAELEHHPSYSRSIEYNTITRKQQHVVNHFYLFQKNMPKQFSNMVAFVISLFGLFILTLIYNRDSKALTGCFKAVMSIIT